MIGSNMAQCAAMMRLTPNICLYDVYAPGLEGVAEEIRHCGFEGLNVTFSTDVKEAFTGAKYIISSGGAPRKQGMTREDLLKGNAAVAEQLGKDIKAYCPDVKHVVIIFNPADITGLVTLLWSGLKPSQVTTLAALDSIRLQSELAKHFGIGQSEVTGCRTYGGHGEQMAVFASTAKVQGTPLTDLIGTDKLSAEQWAEIQQKVVKGGANIINLRGQIIPIIDVRILLGRCSPSENGCIIILNIDRTIIGIYVDTVQKMVDIDRRIILPATAQGTQDLVSGMCSLEDGQTMMVLDCAKILSQP